MGVAHILQGCSSLSNTINRVPSKLTPFTATDFFIGIDSNRTSNGLRYILGTSYKLSDNINLNFQYWRQVGLGEFVLPDAHLFVLDLGYVLKKKAGE